MTTLLAQIAAALNAQRFASEDVPAARNRLRQVRDRLRRHESLSGRDRHWWRLRALEEQLHTLQFHYALALPIAAEMLEAKSGIDLRERLLIEADVLRCCIETQPLETIRHCMEIVFTQAHYADHGLAGHLGHVVCGLLAGQRGDQALAGEFFEKAWSTWSEVWCEPISLVEILTRCAIDAARRRALPDLSAWMEKLEQFHRGYPCDEFRLRFVRLLEFGLLPPSHEIAATIRRESVRALDLLKSLAVRAYYWEYTLALVYLLAASGGIELATECDCLLPVRRKFERQLWLADLAWFAACEAQNVPAFQLDPFPLETPPADRAQVKCLLPRAVRARLSVNYRAVESAARAEDSRLQCGWRQALIVDRLERLATD